MPPMPGFPQGGGGLQRRPLQLPDQTAAAPPMGGADLMSMLAQMGGSAMSGAGFDPLGGGLEQMLMQLLMGKLKGGQMPGAPGQGTDPMLQDG